MKTLIRCMLAQMEEKKNAPFEPEVIKDPRDKAPTEVIKTPTEVIKATTEVIKDQRDKAPTEVIKTPTEVIKATTEVIKDPRKPGVIKTPTKVIRTRWSLDDLRLAWIFDRSLVDHLSWSLVAWIFDHLRLERSIFLLLHLCKHTPEKGRHLLLRLGIRTTRTSWSLDDLGHEWIFDRSLVDHLSWSLVEWIFDHLRLKRSVYLLRHLCKHKPTKTHD
ncbi:hypothetical protein CASFOL_016199 [Castilleja foliolosa]|uniref:Uncharacterized protein n=1 Tax=Castilleja foliolosa TaxID=1961234 RepID=A0ABD3DJX7_9LAMI